MEISIKKADIIYLKDIQNLNNQLFELEYNKFDPTLNVGWTFEKDGEKYFKDMLIEDTNSVSIYLKYYNHFDGYHRIYKIPELTELINKILKNKLEEE